MLLLPWVTGNLSLHSLLQPRTQTLPAGSKDAHCSQATCSTLWPSHAKCKDSPGEWRWQCQSPTSGPTKGTTPHGSHGLSRSLQESPQISGEDSAEQRAGGFVMKSSLTLTAGPTPGQNGNEVFTSSSWREHCHRSATRNERAAQFLPPVFRGEQLGQRVLGEGPASAAQEGWGVCSQDSVRSLRGIESSPHPLRSTPERFLSALHVYVRVATSCYNRTQIVREEMGGSRLLCLQQILTATETRDEKSPFSWTHPSAELSLYLPTHSADVSFFFSSFIFSCLSLLFSFFSLSLSVL